MGEATAQLLLQATSISRVPPVRNLRRHAAARKMPGRPWPSRAVWPEMLKAVEGRPFWIGRGRGRRPFWRGEGRRGPSKAAYLKRQRGGGLAPGCPHVRPPGNLPRCQGMGPHPRAVRPGPVGTTPEHWVCHRPSPHGLGRDLQGCLERSLDGMYHQEDCRPPVAPSGLRSDLNTCEGYVCCKIFVAKYLFEIC